MWKSHLSNSTIGKTLWQIGWQIGLYITCSLVSAAQAQQTQAPISAAQPAVSPITRHSEICQQDGELLEVSLGRFNRGIHEVKRLPSGIYLSAEVLRESEFVYADTVIDCEGRKFRRLLSSIKFEYDPLKTSLKIDRPAELLEGSQVDLNKTKLERQPTEPIFGLAYNFVSRARISQFTTNNTLVLDGTFANKNWNYFFGAQTSLNEGVFSVSPRLMANYQLSPDLRLAASYGVLPFTSAAAISSENNFVGLGVKYGSNEPLDLLSKANFKLPLDAKITVVLDDITLTTINAKAGDLVLSNLPLGQANLKIYAEDETGSRVLYENKRKYNNVDRWNIEAVAGLLDSKAFLDLSTSYSTKDNVSLYFSVKNSRDTLTGSTGLYYSDGQNSFSVANTFGDNPLNTVMYSTILTALADTRLSISTHAPLKDLTNTRFNVSAFKSWNNQSLFANIAAYPLSVSKGWELGVGGYTRLNPEAILGGAFNINRDRWNLGATLNLQALPKVVVTSKANVDANSSAMAFNSSLGVVYRPDDYQRLEASLSMPRLSKSFFSYSYNKHNQTRFSVNSSSADLTTSGLLHFADGKLFASKKAENNYVLVTTGVPNLKLYVNGKAGITDKKGMLFVSANSDRVRINIDINNIPLEVSAKDESQVIYLQGKGVAKIDWTSNFTVSRLIKIMWSRQQVAEATDLYMADSVYPVSSDGYALIPSSVIDSSIETQNKMQVQDISIKSQDGSKSCRAVWANQKTIACFE